MLGDAIGGIIGDIIGQLGALPEAISGITSGITDGIKAMARADLQISSQGLAALPARPARRFKSGPHYSES